VELRVERNGQERGNNSASELGTNQLVCPSFVILEQRKTSNYQLKIKGSYNFHEIGNFLKNRFLIEEIRNFLIIYTP
jgi:hypothetical protein